MTGVAIPPTLSRTFEFFPRGSFVMLTGLYSGISFAVGQAFQTDTKKPSLINISVGIPPYHCKVAQPCGCQVISDGTPALDTAVQNAVTLGIHVVVGGLGCGCGE
jgi:hypothetical protein